MQTSHYQNQVTLDFDERRHFYSVDTVPVPGVTTILSVINKPALVPWAAKLAAETYTALIRQGGDLTEKRLLEIEKAAMTAPSAKKKQAADVGTVVHAWACARARGESPPLPEDERSREGIHAFLRWIESHKVEFLKTELRVFSRRHWYAGTVDFLATIDGRLTIGDYKTSGGIYPEFHLQTAAYLGAWLEEYAPDGTEQFPARAIIRFDKYTGAFSVRGRESATYPNDHAGFLGALALHKALRMAES
jgi:hypothetical protein